MTGIHTSRFTRTRIRRSAPSARLFAFRRGASSGVGGAPKHHLLSAFPLRLVGQRHSSIPHSLHVRLCHRRLHLACRFPARLWRLLLRKTVYRNRCVHLRVHVSARQWDVLSGQEFAGGWRATRNRSPQCRHVVLYYIGYGHCVLQR